MKLRQLARLSRIGNRAVTLCAEVLVLSMMCYGGFALYDDWSTVHDALGENLVRYRPDEENGYSLSQLAEINPDVRGWLTIDDTHISYPIMQGEDDMKYVNLDPLGKFSLSGSVFLSCVNDPEFHDAYSLLYGHHIDNGAMFGDLTKCLDRTYFEQHDKGTLTDLKGNVRDIRIFSVLQTDAADEMVFNPQTFKEDASGLNDYLKTSSLYYRDLDQAENAPIIGLSTCHDTKTNGRVLVFGRLLPTEGDDSQ